MWFHLIFYFWAILLWQQTISYLGLENVHSVHWALAFSFSGESCAHIKFMICIICNKFYLETRIHSSNPVKRFLLITFGENRLICRGCKIAWLLQSSDFTPINLRLWTIWNSSRVFHPFSISRVQRIHLSWDFRNLFWHISFSGNGHYKPP